MFVEARRLADRVAGRIPHDAILGLLELLMLLALAMASARLVWTIMTPVGPFGAWSAAEPASPGPDLASLGSFDPFFRNSDAATQTAVSTLGLTLLGTRVDTVSGRGSAIIAVEDGTQASYGVGEVIVPGVTLKSVGFDEVVLESGGAAESLFLDQSSGGTPMTPEAAGVASAAPKPATASAQTPAPAPRLAADIMFTPRLRGAALNGYVLAPKGSGSAFAAAGLQAGDVLISVDGTPVANIGDPASLAYRIDAGGVGITVERAGKPVNLRIEGRK
jgi:general secretion pathway protein C